MKISREGIDLVKEFESFSAKPYICPAGKLTIGFGHTGNDFTWDDILTRDRAEKILDDDLDIAENMINMKVKVPLTQNQFDALVSFVFNIGVGAFSNSTLLRLLNKRKYSEVPVQLARWNKITRPDGEKVVSRGLVRRRKVESILWSRNEDVDDTMPQKVVSPDKPLIKSRTMANASVMTAVGSAVALAPVIEPAGKVAEIAEDSPMGFAIVAGIIIVCGLIAMYLRWDDKNNTEV